LKLEKIQQNKKTANKRSIDNTKENIGKHMDDATIIQYSFLNTDNLIDYNRQTTKSIKEISLDCLKL